MIQSVHPSHYSSSVLDPKEIVSKLSSSWTRSARVCYLWFPYNQKKISVRICALVIVSVYTVDVQVDAVVAATDSDAGADVAVAVVHVDSTAGTGVQILGPAIAPLAAAADSC